MTNPSPSAKINILTIPSQTTLLFLLIVVVVGGALVIGSVGLSPIPIWPLALAIAILTARSFFARPSSEFARHGAVPAGSRFVELQQAIATASAQVGLSRVPALLITSKHKGLYTFGTWRHCYIAVDAQHASELEEALRAEDTASSAHIRIPHELYHFKSGDFWQLGVVTELLRSTILISAWSGMFFCGWGTLLIQAKDSFLKLDPAAISSGIHSLPPEIQTVYGPLFEKTLTQTSLSAAQQKASTIDLGLVVNFAISTTLPFVLLGSFMWLVFRPKLWRTREFYADAGAVQAVGGVQPFIDAILTNRRVAADGQVPEGDIPRGSGTASANMLSTRLSKWFESFRHLSFWAGDYWPATSRRIQAVVDPTIVFDPWLKTAFTIGSLALVLDILISSPLTLLATGAWPMHFTTIVVVGAVSLSLLQSVLTNKPAYWESIKITVIAIGLRLVWVLITIGLIWVLYLVAPDVLARLLRVAVSAVAHYAGTDNTSFGSLDSFVMQATVTNLAQVLIIAIVTVCSLLVTTALWNRLLTWYRLPRVKQRMGAIAWGIIIWLSAILAIGVLPVATTVLTNPAETMGPGIAVGIAIALLIALGGAAIFIWADQKYSGHCPKCEAAIQGQFQLSLRCPHCGTVLHEWLIAPYLDEY